MGGAGRRRRPALGYSQKVVKKQLENNRENATILLLFHDYFYAQKSRNLYQNQSIMFNRTFFKFLFSFVTVVGVVILIILLLGSVGRV